MTLKKKLLNTISQISWCMPPLWKPILTLGYPGPLLYNLTDLRLKTHVQHPVCLQNTSNSLSDRLWIIHVESKSYKWIRSSQILNNGVVFNIFHSLFGLQDLSQLCPSWKEPTTHLVQTRGIPHWPWWSPHGQWNLWGVLVFFPHGLGCSPILTKFSTLKVNCNNCPQKKTATTLEGSAVLLGSNSVFI